MFEKIKTIQRGEGETKIPLKCEQRRKQKRLYYEQGFEGNFGSNTEQKPGHFGRVYKFTVFFGETCRDPIKLCDLGWVSDKRSLRFFPRYQTPKISRPDRSDFFKTSLKCISSYVDGETNLGKVTNMRDCTIVSLGIGKDVEAEKSMHAALPNCQFFGADPVNETNADIFPEVGKFYNLAVGAKNGTFRSYILEDIYRYQDVKYVDIATFLRTYVKRTVIDQIMIDIEHAEYPMLPLFMINHGSQECHDRYIGEIYDGDLLTRQISGNVQLSIGSSHK
ncbi:hypothetical protein NECAME_01351 [Necator americanus]|uniref:Methyltransferase FkbM domain-containing protein n=1 Tax=Necator americanus TaxID=51031 RepID=W2TWJ5_NECAM|nr:hypothetical protein NECAME_01351 [Necator americanus]ETN86223.1 hypothetical protein NECAME_01351 [Necator americanus]